MQEHVDFYDSVERRAGCLQQLLEVGEDLSGFARGRTTHAFPRVGVDRREAGYAGERAGFLNTGDGLSQRLVRYARGRDELSELGVAIEPPPGRSTRRRSARLSGTARPYSPTRMPYSLAAFS